MTKILPQVTADAQVLLWYKKKEDLSNFPGATMPGKGRSLQCSHQPINAVCSNQILTEVIYLDHLSAK